MNFNDLLSRSYLLDQQDTQLVHVCLDALHNILRQTTNERLTRVTTEIEECGGKNAFLSNMIVYVNMSRLV
jgi:hypothetical protein